MKQLARRGLMALALSTALSAAATTEPERAPDGDCANKLAGGQCFNSFSGPGICREMSWFIDGPSSKASPDAVDAPAGRPCRESLSTVKTVAGVEKNQRLRTCLLCVADGLKPDLMLADLAVLYAPASPEPRCSDPQPRHKLSGDYWIVEDVSRSVCVDSDPTVTQGKPGAPQEFKVILRAFSNQLRHCYDLLLQRFPNISGDLTFEVEVTASGRAQHAKIVAGSLTDSTFRQCVTSRIDRWKFPGGHAAVYRQVENFHTWSP